MCDDATEMLQFWPEDDTVGSPGRVLRPCGGGGVHGTVASSVITRSLTVAWSVLWMLAPFCSFPILNMSFLPLILCLMISLLRSDLLLSVNLPPFIVYFGRYETHKHNDPFICLNLQQNRYLHALWSRFGSRWADDTAAIREFSCGTKSYHLLTEEATL